MDRTTDADVSADPAAAGCRPCEFARRVTESTPFQWAVIVVILLGALLVGLEADAVFAAEHTQLLAVGNLLIQTVFTIEIALRSLAHGRNQRAFLRDGWNIFDLMIVTLGWLPAVGSLVVLARLVRVARVLRLASFSPKLRMLLNAIGRSLPSLGHVALLIGLLIFVYAVIGVTVFGPAHPETWGTLPDAALNVFQLLTLEGWNELQAPLLETNPYAWVYFVSFIVIGGLIIVNLFVAVVLDNMQESRAADDAAELRANAEHGDSLARARLELSQMQEQMDRLKLLLDLAEQEKAEAAPHAAA